MVWPSRRTSTRAAAPSRRCWSSPARCGSATRSSPVRRTAASGRCSTSTASRSRWPVRRVRCMVLGLQSVPGAGDTFIVAPDDRTARQIAETREAADRAAVLAKRRKRISLEDLTEALAAGRVETLNLILKGDGAGSVEALEESLLKIEVGRRGRAADHPPRRGCDHPERRQPGHRRQRDHHRLQRASRRAGRRAGRPRGRRPALLLGHLPGHRGGRGALKGMLKPEYEEVQLGTAEVREVFRSSKFGNIAGCLVRSGVIRRNSKARLVARRHGRGRQPRDRVAASGSRTTPPRSARASSAVSAWGRSTTSASTT